MSSADAISLADSDTDFSGFDSEDLRSSCAKSKKKISKKAVVSTKDTDKSSGSKKNITSTKKNLTSKVSTSQNPGDRPGASKQSLGKFSPAKKLASKPTKTKPASHMEENKASLDFSKLSSKDIKSLKEALGLFEKEKPCEQFATEDDMEEVFGDSLGQLPNIHVSVDRNDLSDGEIELDYNYTAPQKQFQNLGNQFSSALFEEGSVDPDDNSDMWQLPKLKVPERGPAIMPNLAKLINTSCTLPCDTESIMAKYKIPENCTNLGAPLVNNEIWKILDRRARSQDRGIAEIQNLLSVGMVPLIKIADYMKANMQENKEARILMSDIMTVLGQVQYQLSVRRRYLIRPNLNKKYSNLCSVSTPISGSLFGDDIGKEIKNCDSGVSLGKENSFRIRGRGGYTARPFRGGRRGYYSGGSYDQSYQRYSPYPQRGQYRGQYSRPFGSQRGRKIPATATSTSDHTKN